MVTKEEMLLAQGNIPFLFKKFAIPGIIGLLFIGLQPVVDGIILSHFIGTEALAGVNLFMPVYTFMSASAVVVGIGCQTIVSISLGSQNYQRAKNAFKTAFLFLVAYSLIIGWIVRSNSESLSLLLGANETLLPYTRDYISTFWIFFPFLTLLFLGDYILKATGKPNLAVFVLGSVLTLNVILDLLFIGLFDWGVKGAALATGIALGSGILIMLPGLLSTRYVVNPKEGRCSLKLLGEMTYNGSSEGLSELSAGITVFLFNWAMMNTWGEIGVAAFTTINYLLYVGVQLFVGLSDGIIPILSYNYGANNLRRMKETLFLGFKINASIGLLLFAVIFFGGEFLISLFFQNNSSGNVSEILQLASTGASFCAFAFLVNGANIISSSFFTSMGCAGKSAIISLMRGLLLIVIGILLYPKWFGDYGIWMVIPIAEGITFITCLFLIRNKAAWLFTIDKITVYNGKMA